MKTQLGLLLLCLSLTGCAPGMGRSAYMCPPGPCGPSRIVSVNNCEIPGEYQIISPEPSTFSPPTTSVPGNVERRVNSMENELQSLKSDVGDVQRQNDQIDRKLDKVIDHIQPLK